MSQLSFTEFQEYLTENVTKGWRENYTTSIIKNKKNNDQEDRIGLVIEKKGQTDIVPIIYLENYYNEYEEGVNIEVIMSQFRNQYDWLVSTVPDEVSMKFDENRVFYQLINYEKNKKRLQTLPHFALLDLAVVFRYFVNESPDGICSGVITYEQANELGLTKENLKSLAAKNTPELFPMEIIDITNCIEASKLLKKESPFPIYIVSNTVRINGASVLLYADTLKKCANLVGSDFCILPLSIHELVIMPAEEFHDHMRLVVKNTNNTDVLTEDFLSDQVYYYNNETKEISIL